MTNVAGYHLILASEVGERDGLALELTAANGERVAEDFADSQTGASTFRQISEEPLPVAAVEWLLTSARSRL